MRTVMDAIRRVKTMAEEELVGYSKEIASPVEIVRMVKERGRLPVVNFAAGGIATPADAALMMILGADGVFVGSGIFKSSNPAKMANAIVQSVLHYDDPEELVRISEDIGTAMEGQEIATLTEKLQERGW